MQLIRKEVMGMSCRIEHYNTVQKLGKELILLQCGLTECDPSHRCGAASYEHYAIHYIIKGKCRYIAEGKEYDIRAGEGFLIVPHVVNMYMADADDPCTFIYLIFGGEGSEALMKRVGLSYENVTFSFPRDSDYTENLYRIKRNINYERIKKALEF